jgi:hypothetical protein
MEYTLLPQEHDGPIGSKRISFSDGNYWDVLVEIPHGIQSQIRRVSVRNMGEAFKGGEVDRSAITSEQMMDTVEESNALRLVGCTLAWSWKMPITRESVDSLSPRHTKIALEVMSRLHQPDTTATRDEKKTDTSQSLRESHSPNDGMRPVSTSALSNSA